MTVERRQVAGNVRTIVTTECSFCGAELAEGTGMAEHIQWGDCKVITDD